MKGIRDLVKFLKQKNRNKKEKVSKTKTISMVELPRDLGPSDRTEIHPTEHTPYGH
jgi:hypothetical protein